MIWVVGYLPTADGEAALDYAVHGAAAAGARLVVVNTRRVGDRPDAPITRPEDAKEFDAKLSGSSVDYELRQPNIGRAPGVEILAAADEVGADQIVIGMSRRSPVGKMLIGSTTQQVLLEATCPVVAVKAPWSPPAAC